MDKFQRVQGSRKFIYACTAGLLVYLIYAAMVATGYFPERDRLHGFVEMGKILIYLAGVFGVTNVGEWVAKAVGKLKKNP